MSHPDFVKVNNKSQLAKSLMNSQDVIVRLYVCKLTDIVKKDTFSLSDPYIILRLGDTVIDERDNYVEDQNNIFWGRTYEFRCNKIQCDFAGVFDN